MPSVCIRMMTVAATALMLLIWVVEALTVRYPRIVLTTVSEIVGVAVAIVVYRVSVGRRFWWNWDTKFTLWRLTLDKYCCPTENLVGAWSTCPAIPYRRCSSPFHPDDSFSSTYHPDSRIALVLNLFLHYFSLWN